MSLDKWSVRVITVKLMGPQNKCSDTAQNSSGEAIPNNMQKVLKKVVDVVKKI